MDYLLQENFYKLKIRIGDDRRTWELICRVYFWSKSTSCKLFAIFALMLHWTAGEAACLFSLVLEGRLCLDDSMSWVLFWAWSNKHQCQLPLVLVWFPAATSLRPHPCTCCLLPLTSKTWDLRQKVESKVDHDNGGGAGHCCMFCHGGALMSGLRTHVLSIAYELHAYWSCFLSHG